MPDSEVSSRSKTAAQTPFRLTRRFSVAAFASVVAMAGVLGFVLSRLFHEQLLHRDAVVTMEFVQNRVRADDAAALLLSAEGTALAPAMQDAFNHFLQMPDVLRANVYTPDHRAIWSSDRNIMGQRFAHNDELDVALAGRLAFESGVVSKEEHVAAERQLSAGEDRHFVEIYVPVRDRAGTVVGVVELYKTPDALFAAIRDGQRTIAIASALSGLVLFAVLIGIVRRADRIMRDQQRRLLEGERLGAVGEMAAMVAHAIRNPLSVIRTSVEVALDRGAGDFREPAEDIVGEVDKVEEWVRQLLAFSRPGSIAREALDPNAIVRKALASCEGQSRRLEVRVETSLSSPAPGAMGDAALVEQVLVSLVTNALDAMPSGGTLSVCTKDAGSGCEIEVRDTGPGIRAEDLARVFEPFFTTKTRGTGLGLALSRRIIERMGGSLAMMNAPGAGGALARLKLPG